MLTILTQTTDNPTHPITINAILRVNRAIPRANRAILSKAMVRVTTKEVETMPECRQLVILAI